MISQRDYINYRIARAKELMDDAHLLLINKRWRSCVNRLYYSSFQLVGALLHREQIITKTHDGLKTKFFQLFIKTGIIGTEYGKLYGQLFDWRQESDYSEIVEFQEIDVIPLFNMVKEFNELLIKILSEDNQ